MPIVASRHRPDNIPWLARLSFRRKLALIVGIPSLVALVGSLLTLSRVASSYRRAQALEEANASSSFLIQAASNQAKERGFTAAALSDPGAETTRRAIQDLRDRGDQLLASALRAAAPALVGNKTLSAAHLNLMEARRARDARRAQVDEALFREQAADQVLVQAWFDAQTTLIQAERVFGSALFLAQNPYELVIQFNGFIKANVFEASEFAGRERALVGRCIAGGQPIPAGRLEELLRWRGVVEENLAAIAQLRANPAMSPSVLHAIDEMERAFFGGYQQVRASVFAASSRHEAYPLTTDQWIAVSTTGINSILAVSDRIGEEAARISHDQAAFSSLNMLLILGLMSLLLLAVVASVFVARHLTRSLGELRAAAERVSQGIYSQPVGGTGAGGSDEFAELATAFNAMQDRVEAGIAQLQSEKAGVEDRVRARTNELSEANERLVALIAEKDTFLGICSHDLKNPLSGIVGLAGLIQDDATDSIQVRRHAADILQASEFMFELVGNLLDIGAIEQGKFNLRPEAMDLKILVSRGVDSYRRRAAAKQIDLDVFLPPNSIIIRADARAVTQVLDNLISNAVKYTPPGGSVRVGVSSDQSVGQGSASASPGARFTVSDTGPGLSAADQTRLFQKYARLTPPVTGGESSTGLGLSIVKKLVEAMDGTVTCRSALGQGSLFTAEFPFGDREE